MRFSTFWKMQAFELSTTQRMFFRDAISALQTWEIVKKEYAELELIKKILETKINVIQEDALEREPASKTGNLRYAKCIVPREKKS